MKTRLLIALLLSATLAISAGAQVNSEPQPIGVANANLPQQPRRSSEDGAPIQLQVPSAMADSSPQYLQQMDAVLQAMSEEYGQIAQALQQGKITPAQAQYLWVERYYAGLMRLQLIRTISQTAQAQNQPQFQPQADTASPTSDSVVMVAGPGPSPDISQQVVSYLQLTAQQVVAIQGQISSDRKKVQPLLVQLEDSRQALTSVTLSGQFDAKQVQTLAAEQARIMEQLIVADAELQTKIYGLLNSEQQRKFDELRRQTPGSMQASFPQQ